MTTATARTVYSGRSTSWRVVMSALAGSFLPIVLVVTGPPPSYSLFWPFGITIVVIGGVVLTATSVRTMVGPNGIDARPGVIGWPRFHYPLDRVARVTMIQVPGPTGWRSVTWSRRHGITLAVASGPGLRLELTNGRIVTISTPRPDEALRAFDDARRAAAAVELRD